MDEALWCVTYGVLWWWVVLMMRDGAWQGTTSAYNAKLRTNVGICLGTLIPRVRHRSKYRVRRVKGLLLRQVCPARDSGLMGCSLLAAVPPASRARVPWPQAGPERPVRSPQPHAGSGVR